MERGTLKMPSNYQLSLTRLSGAPSFIQGSVDPMSDLDTGDPSHGMQVSRVAPDGPAPNLMHRRRVMEKITTYVGLDVHKETIAVAVADGGAHPIRRIYDNLRAHLRIRQIDADVAGMASRMATKAPRAWPPDPSTKSPRFRVAKVYVTMPPALHGLHHYYLRQAA